MQGTTLCKVHTSAEGNVISLNTYLQVTPESLANHDGIPTDLSPSSTIISLFGGHSVGHYCTCVLKLAHYSYCKPYPLRVVDVDGPTFLGLPTCTDLNLVILNFGIMTQYTLPKPICDPDPIAKEELLREYDDCFKGIGCFQGEFHITTNPTVPPVVHPLCRVPEALKEP